MPQTLLRILLIDDDELDRMAVKRALRAADLPIEIVEAKTGAEGLACLAEGTYECVLLDYQLPDIDGIGVLEAAERQGISTPFVALTGRGDEDLAVSLMKAGATDYVTKSSLSPERITRAIRYARRVHRAEIQAREATQALEEAVEARDSMLAVVSHDLRNPLNAFATSLALLEELLTEPNPTVARTLDAMDRSAQQMNKLLEDLLDVARIEGGRLSVERHPLPVTDLIDEIYETFLPQARDRELEIRPEVAQHQATLHGDRWRLLQVLSNLVGNAIRVTPAGGTIRVGALDTGNGHLRVYVADTGPGIAEDDLPHLFQPFWQSRHTARGGAGLGLAIARGIVEAHDGVIRAESRPGEGATFFLELPIEPPAEKPIPEPDPPPPLDLDETIF
jgi:signal transduction histidine kinase